MMSGSRIGQYYHQLPIYDKMVDEWGIFDTYVDFFVFAASVGYATVDRTTATGFDSAEFTGSGDDQREILWMHLSNKQTYRAVAASIAYQHTGDPKALVNPEVQLEVLARYAKAGAERLEREFGDSASNPRDGLISFIENEHPRGHDAQDDILGGIVESFDRSMIGE